MVIAVAVDDFAQWRSQARVALQRQVPPDEVTWIDRHVSQSMLPLAMDGLWPGSPNRAGSAATGGPVSVPRHFLSLARLAACHRRPERWSLLYRLLWRVVREGAPLLDDAADPDVQAVRQLAMQVRRDEHKMRAFVRFTPVTIDRRERYIAYYRPDHRIVRLAAPFFAERFAAMSWSILTPDLCAHWDEKELTYSEGMAKPPAIDEGNVEELWRTYYAAVFNPARVNVTAMTREMPRRHWAGLPEARLIPSLVSSAHERVVALSDRQTNVPSARPFVPEDRTLPALRAAASGCRGCDLYRHATPVVFGEGTTGGVMLVGEQPGDAEDRSGQPFVGPAGDVLDRALLTAGIDRTTLYVTNAVKHFSFEERGKRRIHKTPRFSEVRACRPWLEAEIQAVRPTCIVCLGATAAQALLGPQVRVMRERGRIIDGTAWAPAVIVSIHPSAMLRADDGASYFAMLVADLKLATMAIS